MNNLNVGLNENTKHILEKYFIEMLDETSEGKTLKESLDNPSSFTPLMSSGIIHLLMTTYLLLMIYVVMIMIK